MGKAENGIGLGCSVLRMFCRLIDMNTYKLGVEEVYIIYICIFQTVEDFCMNLLVKKSRSFVFLYDYICRKSRMGVKVKGWRM